MGLGNEVVSINNDTEKSQAAESEPKSVDGLVADILGPETSDTQTPDDTVEPEKDLPVETVPDNTVEPEREDLPVETEREDTVEPEDENENAVLPVKTDNVQPEAEEEEEEEMVDQVDALRENCQEKSECKKYEEILASCTERVSSRSNTTETCHEEMMDWLHKVDHCVAHSLFDKLK